MIETTMILVAAVVCPCVVSVLCAWWAHRAAERVADLARACLASGRILPIAADRPQVSDDPEKVRAVQEFIARDRGAEMKMRRDDEEPPSVIYG